MRPKVTGMATRTQILETSLQLFLEKGCKNVTMDDIASENGMSKRTLYELFKDKSSLLEESIVTLHERKMEVINQFLTNHENILQMLLESIDNGDEKILDTHYNFMMEIKKYYPELYQKFIKTFHRHQYEMLKKVLDKGVEDGFFIKDGVNYDDVAYSLLLLSAKKTELNMLEYSKFDQKKAVAEMVLLILRGLSTPKGMQIIDNHIKNKLK